VWIYASTNPYGAMRTVISPHPDGDDVTDEIIVVTTSIDARRVADALRRVADDVEARGVDYGAVFV